MPHVQFRRADAVILRDVPRPIRWGARSNNDSETWSCSICLQLNEPSENLLIDLPAFKCRNCWAVRDVSFKFCFGDLLVNGISPIGAIKNQGQTGFCLAYALAMLCEITVRMRYLLLGHTTGLPTLDPLNLLGDHFLQQMMGEDFNDMPEVGVINLGRYDPYSIMRDWVFLL